MKAMINSSSSSVSADQTELEVILEAINHGNVDIEDVQAILNDLTCFLGQQYAQITRSTELDRLLDWLLRILRDFEDFPKLQQNCFELLSKLFTTVSVALSMSVESLKSVCLAHLQSPFARVRVASLHFLSTIFASSSSSSSSSSASASASNESELAGLGGIYARAKFNLQSDLDVEVRVESLSLISILASQFPSFELQSSSSSSETKPSETSIIKLLKDDAFQTVCSAAVNDIDPFVRSQACQCLGQFGDVPLDLFAQMLSKKPLISSSASVQKQFNQKQQQEQEVKHKQKRQKRSDQQKKKKKQRKGEQQVVEGDFIVSNVSEFKSIDQSQCGAVIHGLEDEFEHVRRATLHSLTQICIQHSRGGQGDKADYTGMAVDYFIDSLNDEIEGIRLLAIQCLSKLANFKQRSNNASSCSNNPGNKEDKSSSSLFELTDDQLALVVNCLNDARRDVRIESRKLLGSLIHKSAESVQKIVECVSKGLLDFPDEKDSIHEFLKMVGTRSWMYLGEYLKGLVGKMGLLDDYKTNSGGAGSAREPLLIDRSYLTSMILFSAAKSANHESLVDLPDIIDRHASFLLQIEQVDRKRASELFNTADSISQSYFRLFSSPFISCEQAKIVKAQFRELALVKCPQTEFVEVYGDLRIYSLHLKKLASNDPYSSRIPRLFSEICALASRLKYLVDFDGPAGEEVVKFVGDCCSLAQRLFQFQNWQSASEIMMPMIASEKLPKCSPLTLFPKLRNSSSLYEPDLMEVDDVNESTSSQLPALYVSPVCYSSYSSTYSHNRSSRQPSGKSLFTPIQILPCSTIKCQVEITCPNSILHQRSRREHEQPHSNSQDEQLADDLADLKLKITISHHISSTSIQELRTILYDVKQSEWIVLEDDYTLMSQQMQLSICFPPDLVSNALLQAEFSLVDINGGSISGGGGGGGSSETAPQRHAKLFFKNLY